MYSSTKGTVGVVSLPRVKLFGIECGTAELRGQCSASGACNYAAADKNADTALLFA